MKLLGLRLCEHDSNMSYFDGKKVYYFKSERKYNIKHHAYNDLITWVDEIKKIWNLDLKDLDDICIVLDPWRHKLPTNNENFFPSIDIDWLPINKSVVRVNHHYAHVLSNFMLTDKSDFDIVIDGFGDKNNAWTVFKDDKVYKRGYLDKNGSIGQSMGISGEWLGVKANHECDIAGKVMGLQSYGNFDKGFYDEIKQYDMYSIDKLFNINNFQKYHNDELIAKLKPLDWIRTVHERVGEILLKFFEEITQKDYNATITYSGGVAMNVVWNTVLKQKFKNLVIPPHCADDGLSLGALEFLRRKHKLEKFKLDKFPFIQSDEQAPGMPSDEIITKTAKLLANNKIVGWYQGNGEIGPRALGNRSILMNPLIKNGKDKINKIKQRENYRPFGASILKEHVKEYFNTEIDNPYMLFVGDVQKNNLESITHIDNTCRFQTVDESNLLFFKLLKKFYEITGCPILLNTSFNLAGSPLSHSNDTAKIMYKDLDVLVYGSDFYNKESI